MLRGSFLWGLNICVRQENMEGTDQRLDRLCLHDKSTVGEGTESKTRPGG